VEITVCRDLPGSTARYGEPPRCRSLRRKVGRSTATSRLARCPARWVHAYHYLPNASGRNTRTFVGSYDFQLEKDEGTWRIRSFKYNLKLMDGNLTLESS
jgi:hypothetical protein